jgi:hypothetical protein
MSKKAQKAERGSSKIVSKKAQKAEREAAAAAK